MAEIITAIGRKEGNGGLLDAKSIKTNGDHLDDSPALFDFRVISLPTIFDDFHDGVTITNAEGRVVRCLRRTGPGTCAPACRAWSVRHRRSDTGRGAGNARAIQITPETGFIP